LLISVVVPAHAIDYFGRPESPPSAVRGHDQPVAHPSHFTLPEPFRTLLGKAVVFQSKLNARLRSELRAAREEGSWHVAMIIVFASFLYGVLHAVGPGHGKVVVTSYLLTRRARFFHALGMSAMVAATQAVTAVTLTGILAALFGATGKTVLDRAASIEVAGYAAITVLGLWMAWSVIRPGSRRECGCGLPHHHHKHHHDEHCRHATERNRLAEILTTSCLAGLRPCSGAILVLLFTLANGIFTVGIAAVIAMGIGVAITVAAVSIGAFGINRAVAATGAGRSGTIWMGRIAAFSGAMLIAAFGASALIAIASGAVAPMIG
jgi:nickel/cobalt exporter